MTNGIQQPDSSILRSCKIGQQSIIQIMSGQEEEPLSMLLKLNTPRNPNQEQDLTQSKKERVQSAFQYISNIFENEVEEDDPHVIQSKNILLIILLTVTAYAIYSLFREFLDTIVIAFLSGVAYGRLRDNFVNFWRKNPGANTKITGSKILLTAFYLFMFFILPWIRRQAKKGYAKIDFSLVSMAEAFVMTTNAIIRVAQLYFLTQAINNAFGERLRQVFSFEVITPRVQTFLKSVLAVMTVFIVLLSILGVVIVLANETNKVVKSSKGLIEGYWECELDEQIILKGKNKTVACSEKMSSDIQKYMPRSNNKTHITLCTKNLKDMQMNYLGADIIDYEEDVCEFKEFIEQVSPNVLESFNFSQTSKIIFNIFGIIAQLLTFLSNGIFSLTTFLAIFMTTVSYYRETSNHLEIFGEKRKKLVDQITKLISGTIFITIEHLFLGVFLFEVFRFTDFNVILSMVLSLIAFVPLVQPSLLVFIVGGVKMFRQDYYMTPIICMVLYWSMSQTIYKRHHKGIDLHEVIVNLSVVFGIYQFGVSGIFYGPLIILLFQAIYEVLFTSKN